MHQEREFPTAKLRLSSRRMTHNRGHLWVYAGHIEKIEGTPAAGDVVDVVTPDGKFVARGLYSPESKIRVRLLTFDEESISEQFWRERVMRAIRLRERIVAHSTAYRLIYGEADLLPGLIVDRYSDVAVMQTLYY